MTSARRRPLIPLALVATLGCGASVQSVVPSPETRLRDYAPMFVALLTASGGLALSGGQLGALVGGTLSDGEREAVRALESFKFELMAGGVTVIADSTKAGSIVEFSIGSIRYDPLAGWIADQALAKVRRVGTGEVIAFYRANAQAITPTVNKLVGSLAQAMLANY